MGSKGQRGDEEQNPRHDHHDRCIFALDCRKERQKKPGDPEKKDGHRPWHRNCVRGGNMEKDEKIIQKMVNTIAESNAEFLGQKQDSGKFSKIVPQLLKKGLDNLNLSMFSPELKYGILTSLGEEYRKRGNLNDAVKTFVLAGNRLCLNEVAEDYLRLQQFDNSIEAYKLAGNKEKLLEVGKKCLYESKIGPAMKAFIAIGDTQKLIEVGEQCIGRNRFDFAFEIFSKIKDSAKLVELGN